MNLMRIPLSLKIVLALIFSILMVGIAGFTPRASFSSFIVQYSVAFIIYYVLIRSDFRLRYLLGLGLIARISLVFFSPELSNDFYRFIWDGELILQGINPFNYKPNDLISYGQFLSNDYYLALHRGMGDLSQSHYSCYPVLNQLIFAFSCLFSDSIAVNTAVMKGVIIIADIGSVWVGIKILKLLNLSGRKIAWYFLNPLIILEFSGNLHFEGVMIFFLLCFVYFTIKNNWMLGGLFLALAIQIKLIPLMFIPFVYKRLKWKGAIGFTAVTMLVVILMSQLMLSSHNIDNFLASLQLYFDKFQFNASLFSWANEFQSAKIGWDTTESVGPLLSKIGLVLIVLLAVFKAYKRPTDIFIGLVFSLTIYYVFATTVHPWYLSLILVFSIFTRYRFSILWTFLAGFSYLAYSDPNFTENKLLNSILYVVVFVYIIVELYRFWRIETAGLNFKEFFDTGTNP
ncbi:MAG: glycosyltransferase family 87 protein [Crocinitomicaceae bacterium]